MAKERAKSFKQKDINAREKPLSGEGNQMRIARSKHLTWWQQEQDNKPRKTEQSWLLDMRGSMILLRTRGELEVFWKIDLKIKLCLHVGS